MAGRRRGWDDPWQHYAESKPIRTDNGIATSRARGSMATAWWSQRLVDLLDSYGLGARMKRGKRYARQGQLVSFDVQPGLLLAQVQGSRPTPYVVSVSAPTPTERQWAELTQAIRGRAAFVAKLLAGELPPELELVFDDVGVALLPTRWADVRASCSCPDWESPCKHVAATLYVFADQLDHDPWLLLAWRGRTRNELLEHLGRRATVRSGIAPWWPLVPGARLPEPSIEASALISSEPPVDPAGVLARCQPLDLKLHGTPVVDALAPAYRALRPDQ